MTSSPDPWSELGDWDGAYLNPQSILAPDQDMAGFGKALALTVRGLMFRPSGVTAAAGRFALGLARLPAEAAARWFGQDERAPFVLEARDRRFADAAWKENPAFYALRQVFTGVDQLTDELISAAGLSAITERKAHFAAGLMVDLLAPTNFLPLNPAALRRAFETGGMSVLRGARNFLDDALHNKGRPRQVDASSFVIGGNLAATPCDVVYRNEMMEVLQYAPQTEQVHANPLLCSPPWINKYYIMDLAPGRSFIEWAVKQNRTVFSISYLNPGPELSHLTLDDYLTVGLERALEVVADITGARTIDIAGLCLGGALTAIAASHLAQLGDSRVGNLTLMNTMLDYAEPGVLGVFTEPGTIDRLEEQMAKTGILDGASMAGTFDALRPNDLIFNYVVSNWLMGQNPPAFDILAWNADSTRMPAAMHAFYLRNFYVENLLAAGKLKLAGHEIHLGDVSQDTYIVGAENDHIVPWPSAYASTHLLGGRVRFVLSSGGHIAGVVNPPGPKGWYIANEDAPPPTAEAWRTGALRHDGSWWEDWARWGSANSGALVDPPAIGSGTFPVLGPGPGGYVMT